MRGGSSARNELISEIDERKRERERERGVEERMRARAVSRLGRQ
jgi:hypothetical protein